MTARYVSGSERIDFQPVAAVAAGDVVVLGTLVGIATAPIAAGTLGSLAVAGIFSAPKNSVALTTGQVLFWDAANRRLTPTATGNTRIGLSIADVPAAEPRADVLLGR